jgi:hypothetical protein
MMTTQAPNFGQAWGTPLGQDISMPSYMASGNQAVAEAILRRWTTTQGELIDDPNYGRNVYDLIGDDLSPRDLAMQGQQFGAEAEKDPRVTSCRVVITMDAQGNLTFTAAVVTALGPFPLVVSVNAVTLALLLVQP